MAGRLAGQEKDAILNKPKLTRWIATTPQKPWQAQPLPRTVESGAPDLQLSGCRYQAWDGFGACFNELAWIALSMLNEAERRKVLANLYGDEGCRFRICRVPIGASDYAAEWYSHNETGGDFAMEHFSIERDRGCLIPFIKAAKAASGGFKLFASPWSPPTWFKFPKTYNHGRMIWKPEYLKAYALYFLKFVEAYRAEGVVVDQVHVQNEPLANQNFPSCLWTGEQMREFIRDYLGPLFRKKAPDCEVWLGTLNTNDYDGYVHAALSDPKANAFIAGVGFQWAGRGAIQRAAESWPEKRLMQTETECGEGKNTWEQARAVFSIYRHYIANGTNGCVYWNVSQKPGGVSTWGWPQNALTTVNPETKAVTYNPDYYVVRHFSRFIEVGATRLGLRGPWTGDSVAFANPDGTVAVVVANPFPDARRLSFGGPSGGFAVSLPGYSFNTLEVVESRS